MMARIESLATDPRPPGCEKLTGGDRYKVRQGDYRIVYSVDDADITVYVVKVGHRSGVYRGWWRETCHGSRLLKPLTPCWQSEAAAFFGETQRDKYRT